MYRRPVGLNEEKTLNTCKNFETTLVKRGDYCLFGFPCMDGVNCTSTSSNGTLGRHVGTPTQL